MKPRYMILFPQVRHDNRDVPFIDGYDAHPYIFLTYGAASALAGRFHAEVTNNGEWDDYGAAPVITDLTTGRHIFHDPAAPDPRISGAIVENGAYDPDELPF